MEENDNKPLAQVAYDGYREHTGGRSLATGQPIPTWEDLKPEIQQAWAASTRAVVAALQGVH